MKTLKILRKIWGWGSSENSEDDDLQKIQRMKILRKFWGWRSSENSEEHPLKFMRVFQKNAAEFSENSEDSIFFGEKHQKTLIMTIPVIIGYIRCSSERRSLQKNVSQGTKPSTKHGPVVYTDNTQCFTCFVCFSLIIKAIIYFLLSI